jgi:hypothetical protein
MGVWGQFD